MDENQQKIIPIIMSGGNGKRLWPFSRSGYPKQLLRLYNHLSLLQNTLLRCQKISCLAPPIIIANQKRRFVISSQIAEINVPVYAKIMEPEGHNTAPAIAIAALYAKKHFGDALLLILPSDHLLMDSDAFEKSILVALESARKNEIVLFGIKPENANPNYGYIEINPTPKDTQTYLVKRFVEKPTKLQAAELILDEHYFWNSGIYLFQASRIVAELSALAPDILSCCDNAIGEMKLEHDYYFLPQQIYKNCRSISLEYAIHEKITDLNMVPLDTPWHDIGGWKMLYEIEKKDANHNVLHGNALAFNSQSCYLRSEHKLIIALGLKDCFVIQSDDVLLVANKENLEELPDVVQSLEETHRSEATTPLTSHRPWGYYTTIDMAENYHIKKMVIYPGQQLSLQEHQYRSEHWIILKGHATITLGYQERQFSQNDCIYVPIGMRHRIINTGHHNLELIEIQTGSYFGEDDIKRRSDIYHRSSDEE